MFNPNDVVTIGIRNISLSRKSWGRCSHIPRYTGIINTVSDKQITIYVPGYSRDGEVVATLRSNGRWIQQGAQDDKFDRVSVKEYNIGAIDVTMPREYQTMLDLGVDKRVLDAAIEDYLSQEVDTIKECIQNAVECRSEETTDKGREYWDGVKANYEHQLTLKLDECAQALRLKNETMEPA